LEFLKEVFVKSKTLSLLVVCIAGILSSYAGNLSRSSMDAVTAATANNECKFVLPIQTTATSATVTWTETHKDGAATFWCDIVNPPVVKRAVTSNERANKTISVTNLNPNTPYYIRIEMLKSGESPYAATGSFTTKATTTGVSSVFYHENISSHIAGNKLILGSEVSAGDRITLTDFQGRTVYTHIRAAGETSVSFSEKSPGAYLVGIKRNNAGLETFLFISGMRSF
jgi:hypothetical protein